MRIVPQLGPKGIRLCGSPVSHARLRADMTVSSRPRFGLWLIFVPALAFTGCMTTAPSPVPAVATLNPSPTPSESISTTPTARGSIEPNAPTPSPSTSVMALASPSTTPVNLPDLIGIPPVGNLLVSRRGNGTVAVSAADIVKGSTITIRFACVGNNAARLEDEAGALILGVSACEGTAIYATSFTSSANDRSIRIRVAPQASWAIAVWTS